MKVSALSVLLLAVATHYASAQDTGGSILSTDEFEDCADCLEDLDDARDCLRECQDIDDLNSSGDPESRLANCLDPSRSGSSVESLDELVDCCSFDDDCEDDLEDVQECLDGCLDTCISTFADDYLECIRDNAGDSDCDLDECIDGFLDDDLEDSLDVSASGSKDDLFSISAIERRIERIEEDDLEDCNLLEDFVDSICDIGVECCDECENELGLFVDCIVNDIVIPFVAIETNETILSCPIDTEECELDSRSRSRRARRRTNEARPLSMEEEKLFAKALSLPSKKTRAEKEARRQTKRNAKREQVIEEILGGRRLEKEDFNTTEAIESCLSKMRLDILAHNVTHATNLYTECIAVAAVQTLEANTETDSGAGTVSTFAALAVAMAGIAFF